MITKSQIQIVQIARRQAGLNEPQYRMLLANVAGVASTTQLDNTQVEDVMDVLEGLGFVDSKNGAGYWGGKVQRRGTFVSDRMQHKIRELVIQQQYPLEAMVHRFSGKRTDRLNMLYPCEAWQMIEGLKKIIERDES